jgi:hypothetical protein
VKLLDTIPVVRLRTTACCIACFRSRLHCNNAKPTCRQRGDFKERLFNLLSAVEKRRLVPVDSARTWEVCGIIVEDVATFHREDAGWMLQMQRVFKTAKIADEWGAAEQLSTPG